MLYVYCFTLSDEFLTRHYEEKARQRQAIQEEKRKVYKIIDYIIDKQPQMVLACSNVASMFKNPFLDFCVICH